jgi:FkbM family methyltransferase
VIVYEPATENFELLKENIASNKLEWQIQPVLKAVSSYNGEVNIYVQKEPCEEIHVSSHKYGNIYRQPAIRKVNCITPARLFELHSLREVDIMKMDVEGAEYDIIDSMGDDLFLRIKNFVFEYHHVSHYEKRLSEIISRLKKLGYEVSCANGLVRASHE